MRILSLVSNEHIRDANGVLGEVYNGVVYK